MYHRRASLGPVDLAFTDRYGGASRAPFDELNLALEGYDDPATCAANLATVTGDFAPGGLVRDMRQVHGADVVRVGVDQKPRPDADALVTTDPDVVLVVRVADCVPVLMADAEAGVVAAAHAGRPGMLAGVVPATVAAMHELGARDIHAWIGPHVCGGCYEVPEQMQADAIAQVPEARATTTWGTPALDIGAGVRAQLLTDGVAVTELGGCTREDTDLYSYRRDGRAAGRLAGLVRRKP